MQETLSAEELLPSGRGAAAVAQQFRCGPCAASFATLDELKAHYRSELHKANRERGVATDAAQQSSSAAEQFQSILPGKVTAKVGLVVDPGTRGLVVKTESSPAAQAAAHENEDAARAGRAGVPLWMTIENEQAWEWFKELDDDSSGVLEEDEAKRLCKKLNLKVSKFHKIFAELDTGGDGTVSFVEFVHWFNERKTSERREMRLQVRDLFEKMDRDRSGKLSKEEISSLVKKSKNKLNLVDPPFDVDRDWEVMKKTDGEVTFPHFEGWWKDRSGIVDVDIPVLPEFMVLRIGDVGQREWRSERHRKGLAELLQLPLEQLTRQDLGRLELDQLAERIDPSALCDRRARERGMVVSDDTTKGDPLMALRSEIAAEIKVAKYAREQQVLTDEREVPRTGRQVLIDLLMEQKGTGGVDYHRSGTELWGFLRPRLKFIVELQKEWGNIHQLYPSKTESVYEDLPLPPGIRDPDSTASGIWDLAGLFFLLSVSVLVPLRSCFDIEVPFASFAWFFDLLTDIYFIIDLVLNFFTAYHDKKGMREARKSMIRRNYLQTWFFIDFFSCLPVGYVSLVAEAMNGGGEEAGSSNQNTRAFKALRLLRLAKMLRLAKVLKIFEKYAESLSMFMGVYVMIFAIFFVAHLLSCFWYMIGDADQLIEGNTELTIGWVGQMEWENKTLVPLSTKYTCALGTVFAALEWAATDSERRYAVFAELCVGFIFGALAGVMTQIMASMKGNDQEFTLKLQGMKQWLKDQGFSKPEQKKVLNYFSEVWATKTLFNEAEILEEMPPAMRNTLVQQLYKPVVQDMPLFKGLAPEIIAAICLAARPMMAIKNQEVMSEGMPGREMFMLLSGEVEVSKGRGNEKRRLGFLSEGAFFGENPVLADGEGTEIRSRTVTAVTECKLCYLFKEDLAGLMQEYPAFAFRVQREHQQPSQLSRCSPPHLLLLGRAGFRKLGMDHNKGVRLARLGSKSLTPTEVKKIGDLSAKSRWQKAGGSVMDKLRLKKSALARPAI